MQFARRHRSRAARDSGRCHHHRPLLGEREAAGQGKWPAGLSVCRHPASRRQQRRYGTPHEGAGSRKTNPALVDGAGGVARGRKIPRLWPHRIRWQKSEHVEAENKLANDIDPSTVKKQLRGETTEAAANTLRVVSKSGALRTPRANANAAAIMSKTCGITFSGGSWRSILRRFRGALHNWDICRSGAEKCDWQSSSWRTWRPFPGRGRLPSPCGSRAKPKRHRNKRHSERAPAVRPEAMPDAERPVVAAERRRRAPAASAQPEAATY